LLPDGVVPSPFAPEGVVPSPPFGGGASGPPLPLGPSSPLGLPLMSACFGGGAPLPGLMFFNAFAASPNRSPARLSSGTSALSAVTSRFTRSAIFDAVFATAPMTCGTTQVMPMPKVKTTCSAQLMR
jgi:hypothetical protein